MHDLPIPAPSAAARARAIDQALSVFDQQQLEKIKNRQGLTTPQRLKHRIDRLLERMGDWNMNRRTLTTTAAAACVIAVVAVVVTHQIAPLEKQKPQQDSSLNLEPSQRLPAATMAAVKPSAPVATKTESAELISPAAPVPAAGLAKPEVATRKNLAAESSRHSTTVANNLAADKAVAAPAIQMLPAPAVGGERDQFDSVEDNPVRQVADHPVSTFSIDVDTSSYSFNRRLIQGGRLPVPNQVRVEEMINYFRYDYRLPSDRSRPFEPTVALYPTPWNDNTRLLHIGIKGYGIPDEQRPTSHLVFLIDVSGSMNAPDRLELVKQSLALLVDALKPEDTVAIVVYAGAAGTVLEPTPIRQRQKILAALHNLKAGGSTAGGEGIQLAYALAESHFEPKAINRVILATDGDFNVGITNPEELKGMVARKRQSGIFLSVLGVGQGNYNDRMMQQLAQNGNGVAAYIDSLSEARKVLVEEAASNLFPIAKDVKIQVEFNPSMVKEYRLIGYETRMLRREDFNNDQVDAGDIGAGHSVTALYEIVPASSTGLIEPLRYATPPKNQPATPSNDQEWAFLQIRYKLPDSHNSQLIRYPIRHQDEKQSLDQVHGELRFAAAVAAFGQKLRGGRYLGHFGYDQMIAMAHRAKGDDLYGHRAELVQLMRMAQSLDVSGAR
ncbi:MAG: VWA domain-containing protein [Magnetococcales bacterium]|nr:VWA domain-containing protein [Magnetococcales bacterium]